MNNCDNIVAIATSHGYAGVGIIRISGNNLLAIAKILTKKSVIKPKIAYFISIYNHGGIVIDTGLLLYFASPYSFTGEDVIELQVHGSPVAMHLIIERCLNLGCRLATAGEFSKRAFLNNKIDLIQAESIIDLIHAQSMQEVYGATQSLCGTFSTLINNLKNSLIKLRTFIEASLDFPDEDIEFIANAKIKEQLQNIHNEITQLLHSTKQGVLLNNGANVVIVGRPNVGKSSLLNCLAQDELAIVTNIAGTTRDIIKQKILINGIAINLIDTAGIHDTDDVIEQIGINKAHNAINNANLCLIIIDDTIGLTRDDDIILQTIPHHVHKIFIYNKIDLTNKHFIVETVVNANKLIDTKIFLSVKKQLGIDLLRNEILHLLGFDNNNNNNEQQIYTARLRHLEAIKITYQHIELALTNWHNLEIIAEELRLAHNSLFIITGEFSSDDLLGEIFSNFCIGK